MQPSPLDVGLAQHYAIQIERQQIGQLSIVAETPATYWRLAQRTPPREAPPLIVRKWMVEAGEQVIKGEVIAMLSLGDMSIEVEATDNGVLANKLVRDGGYVPSSGVIGRIAQT